MKKNRKTNSHIQKKPSCVVLMSTFNGEKYIEQQLDSVLKQKDVDIRVLVRDDGSSDGTIAILEKYKKQYGNLTIICGKNVGIHKSFSYLIQNCHQADYVAFSDQDDFWESDKLFVAIKSLRDSGMSFYSSASKLADENLNDLRKTTENLNENNYYMFGNNKLLTPGVQGCTIVIDYNFFAKRCVINYPDNYGHDVWLAILAYYFKCAIYDPRPHMLYRQHNNSWTGNRNNALKRFFKTIKYSIKGMERYSTISMDMLSRFETDLEQEDVEVLRFFSNLCEYSMHEKRVFVKKHKIGKYRAFPNILFRWFVFFKNKKRSHL